MCAILESECSGYCDMSLYLSKYVVGLLEVVVCCWLDVGVMK